METGKHYNYFRDYDPAIGRYVESDPVGLVGGLNSYGYVEQEPLASIDPNGLIRMYGNWCGPDWTGGHKRTFAQLTLRQRGNAKKPIDPLDAACRSHDICFAGCQAEFPCSADKRSTCFRICDFELKNRTDQVGGYSASVIGIGINRPGKRDPGSNDPRCGGCPSNRDKKWHEF